MAKKRLAKSSKEFDRRFDSGEDINELIDISRATIMRPGEKAQTKKKLSAALLEERAKDKKREAER